MFQKWKEKLIGRQCKAPLCREAEYKDGKDVKTCLAVAAGDAEGQKAVAELAVHLKGVELEVLYLGKAGTGMEDVAVIGEDDFTFWGKVKNEHLKQVLDKQYDMLVDLTPRVDVVGRYILAHSRASFAVGMKKEGGLADLVVAPAVDVSDFIKQLTVILAQIKRY